MGREFFVFVMFRLWILLIVIGCLGLCVVLVIMFVCSFFSLVGLGVCESCSRSWYRLGFMGMGFFRRKKLGLIIGGEGLFEIRFWGLIYGWVGLEKCFMYCV